MRTSPVARMDVENMRKEADRRLVQRLPQTLVVQCGLSIRHVNVSQRAASVAREQPARLSNPEIVGHCPHPQNKTGARPATSHTTKLRYFEPIFLLFRI